MSRIRFILVGAVIGLTWAASLRGFMQQLAGPDSTFTFTGTFGIIIPTGIIVGALLGWAEHQRRTGAQHPILILAPLLIGIIPNLAAGPDPGPIGLALLAMAGGYAVSGRGPTLDADRGRHRQPRRHSRHLPGTQALSGPQLHHTARCLVRHPGGVPGRDARPGLLHPDAPARH
jgi:hypothetical protein